MRIPTHIQCYQVGREKHDLKERGALSTLLFNMGYHQQRFSSEAQLLSLKGTPVQYMPSCLSNVILPSTARSLSGVSQDALSLSRLLSGKQFQW